MYMMMKRILPIVLLLMTACAPKEITIDFPFVEAANSLSVVIEKVEMTDSLTSLHLRGYHIPGYWIRITKDVHLVADGISYEMVGAEGIVHRVSFSLGEHKKGVQK